MGKFNSPAGRLVSQGGVYAIGNALVKLSGLLLAPLYLDVAILSREEYGQFALLDVTGSLSILLFGLGLASAVIKFSADEGMPDRESIPFTALVVSIASGFLAALVFLVLSGKLSTWFLASAEQSSLIRWYGLYVGLQVCLLLPYAFIRFHEKAALFVVARVAEIALLIVGVYYFLAHLQLGLMGIVYAYVCSAAVAFLILIGGMLSQIQWLFRVSTAKTILAYGVPLAIGLVAAPLLHAGDRYLIDWILGEEPLSRYFWATRLSGVLNMFVIQSFSLAFAVIGIKALSRTTVDISLHRRSFRHYMIWGGWIVLGLSLLAPNVTALLTDESDYVAASTLVFPLSLGYLFYGAYLIVVNALYADGRTRTIGLSVFGAALLNAVLNVVLLNEIGLSGAALATVLSYFVLFAVTARIARTSHQIDYSWLTMVAAVGLSLVLYVIGLQASTVEVGTWTADLFVRIAIIAVYPILVVGLRLYRPSELKEGLARVRSMMTGT